MPKTKIGSALEICFIDEITFEKCACSSCQMLAVRQVVNQLIKNNI